MSEWWLLLIPACVLVASAWLCWGRRSGGEARSIARALAQGTRPLVPPPVARGAFVDVMRDGQLMREVSFTHPATGVVQTMRLGPTPPRRCRFKRSGITEKQTAKSS